MAYWQNMLLVLKDADNLQAISLDLQKPQKNVNVLFLENQVLKTIIVKHKVQSIFQINFQPNWFGSLSTDGVIHFFKVNKKIPVFDEFESKLHSSSTLFCSGSIYTNDQNSLSINVHSIQFNDDFDIGLYEKVYHLAIL